MLSWLLLILAVLLLVALIAGLFCVDESSTMSQYGDTKDIPEREKN